MHYLSVAETAKLWNISERSVRNYCAQGRVDGAFLTGKTWNIPEHAQKPERKNKKKDNIKYSLGLENGAMFAYEDDFNRYNQDSNESEPKWQFELESYIKQGEPGQIEKSEAWQTAIGLQAVDGLKTSAYLLDTAKEHIEGKISIDDVQNRIQSYYDQRTDCLEIEHETKEADIVSARIAKILSERTFQMSPAEWFSIHRRLFEGVFNHAGQVRKYNITKKEWVLKGDTVIYAAWDSIKATLDYDFGAEKQFSYEGLSADAVVKHLAKFASDIWQIHPFEEGNTRATAVFMIKYMKTFGFKVNNDAFEKHSWYFRNALVRANYTDIQNGIYATTKYLEMFFSNVILETDYELKNRHIHVDYVENNR